MRTEEKLLGSVLMGLIGGKIASNVVNDIIKKHDEDVKAEREFLKSQMDSYAEAVSKIK